MGLSPGYFCMTPHVIFGGKYMYVSHLKEKIKTCFTIASMYILFFFSKLHCTAVHQNYIYVKAKKNKNNEKTHIKDMHGS